MTPDVPDQPEDGEAMDDIVEDDDEAMMAMMGVSGFGSTKVKKSK
jgi:U4/U6.U5 tri-snRNP-associated protein 3